MALNTRAPTGEANWPMLLVEGKEGARKTSEALRLSADPRIGDAYVIEVGERRVDEYATLGNFQVVEHDGQLRTIVPAIREVMAQPPREGRPTLLLIDSGTHLWDLVNRAAEAIARGSKAAKAKLADDPDAEIEVGHQAWNRAKDPWYWSWLNDLRGWPGIVVMTARADEVSKFVDGRPVLNQTDYRIDIERGTPFIFDATVRMRGARPALVTTAKSLKFSVPDGGLELPAELPLAHLVFDLFQAGTSVVLTVAQAKQSLVAVALALTGDDETAKSVAAEAWRVANGQRATFDHHAMSALIAALDPSKVEPSVSGAAESPPDTATSPPAASEPDRAPDTAPDAEAHTETIVQRSDRDAFNAAPAEVVDPIVAEVRRLLAGEVDAQLDAAGLPSDGKIEARRARLAARRVRLAVEQQVDA